MEICFWWSILDVSNTFTHSDIADIFDVWMASICVVQIFLGGCFYLRNLYLKLQVLSAPYLYRNFVKWQALSHKISLNTLLTRSWESNIFYTMFAEFFYVNTVGWSHYLVSVVTSTAGVYVEKFGKHCKKDVRFSWSS